MSSSGPHSTPWELGDPWVWRPLGEVANFIRGLAFKPEDKLEGSQEGAVPCLRTSNVQEEVEWDDLIFIDESHVRDESKWLRRGDTLMSTANSGDQVGRVALVGDVPRRSTLGAFIGLIRSSGEVLPEYLYYWLNHPYMRGVVISQARQTTNIANVSIPRLLENPVPVPPLEVQQNVVDTLRKIQRLSDAAWKGADAAVQLPNSLLEAKLADSSTWKESTLEELSTEIRYGMSRAAADATGSQYRYIRITDIDDRTGRLHGEGAIAFDDLDESEVERFRLSDGDLLFARTGSIGTTYLYENGDGSAVFASYLIRARLDSSLVDPRFVALWVRSQRAQAHLTGNSRGQVQQNINSKVIKTLKVPVPPTEIQEEIVQAAVQARAVREAFAGKAEILAKLKTSLAVKSFMGELRGELAA